MYFKNNIIVIVHAQTEAEIFQVPMLNGDNKSALLVLNDIGQIFAIIIKYLSTTFERV